MSKMSAYKKKISKLMIRNRSLRQQRRKLEKNTTIRREAEQLMKELETLNAEGKLLKGNESGPMRPCERGLSSEELHALWERENELWKETSVPLRRNTVEAIPPEDESLTEEEERLKVLLENFHLSKRENIPPPQEENHYPIDREWYDALIWRENRRKHSDGDCLITRVVRQSKLTDFFKPKKNN